MKICALALFISLSLIGCSSGDSGVIVSDNTTAQSGLSAPLAPPTIETTTTPVVNLAPEAIESPEITEQPAVVITPAVVTTTTPEPTPEISPAASGGTADSDALIRITAANYEAMLNQVLGVFAGQRYGLQLMQLPSISERRYQQFPAITESASLTCNNGGNIDITGELPVFYQSIWNYNFTDCVDDDTQLNGSLYRLTDSQRIVWSSGFSQVRPRVGDEIRFDGGANFLFMNARGGSSRRIWSTDELSLTLTNNDDEITVSNASTFFETVVPFTAFLGGSFSYSSELTNGQTVTASVTQDFVYSDLSATFSSPDWRFTDGTLLISTESGDSMLLRASTGNDDTVEIEINNEDGQSVVTEPWSKYIDSLVMPTDFAPDYAE